jgi:hypothetical protein
MLSFIAKLLRPGGYGAAVRRTLLRGASPPLKPG